MALVGLKCAATHSKSGGLQVQPRKSWFLSAKIHYTFACVLMSLALLLAVADGRFSYKSDRRELQVEVHSKDAEFIVGLGSLLEMIGGALCQGRAKRP